MSRKERSIKKVFKVFCEGDTEYNYFDNIRTTKNISLAIRPVNMGGGGYANFISKLKCDSNNRNNVIVNNKISVKKKIYEITVEKTEYYSQNIGKKGTNINDFFDVLDKLGILI